MKKLGNVLPLAVAALGGDRSAARIQARTAQVLGWYKSVVKAVYRENAPLFLEHTNAVYCSNRDGVRTFTVYVDESIFAADLNARRELMKMKLMEFSGEDIEMFDIRVSRGGYKKRRPFVEEDSTAKTETPPSVSLDEGERACASSIARAIDDPSLRRAAEKAILADFEFKKALRQKAQKSSK